MSQTKKVVMIVDDDVSLLESLGDFLRHEGYDVVTAASGEEGLERLRVTRPDLIILDMSMPGMGGIGFLKAISDPDGKPMYPVLVLTARANMAEFFANVDVDGFIAKPCSPDDLLMEVGRIIFLRSGTIGGGKHAGYKVLLVEDDEERRKTFIDELAKMNYEVIAVKKGPEAIEKAITEKPDLVVIKLFLPDMNGDACIVTMSQLPSCASLPIILYDDGDSLKDLKYYQRKNKNVKRAVKINKPEDLVSVIQEVIKVISG